MNVVKLPGFYLSEGLRIPPKNFTPKKKKAYFILFSLCYKGNIKCDSSIPF